MRNTSLSPSELRFDEQINLTPSDVSHLDQGQGELTNLLPESEVFAELTKTMLSSNMGLSMDVNGLRQLVSNQQLIISNQGEDIAPTTTDPSPFMGFDQGVWKAEDFIFSMLSDSPYGRI